MIDEEKIENKLKTIVAERNFLETFKPFQPEELPPEDNVTFYAILHSLQVALQAVLDVSQYILAHEVLGGYKENKEVFLILSKHKILSLDLAKRLEAAIGVRNIIVHQYEEVDPKIIEEIIGNNLEDFDKFVLEINGFLKKPSGI